MNQWSNDKILKAILSELICEEKPNSPIIRRRVKQSAEVQIFANEISFAYCDFIYQFLSKRNLPENVLSSLFGKLIQGINIKDFTNKYAENGISNSDLSMHAIKQIRMLGTNILQSGVNLNTSVMTPHCCYHSIKNTRRSMEDRHVIMPHFAQMFNLTGQWHFYGVFDGHGGEEAAQFSAFRLPYILGNLLEDAAVVSCDDEAAKASTSAAQCIKSAITLTDQLFTQHANISSNASGCTAVCVLLEGVEKVHVAWVGDSQAVLFKESGGFINLTPPHKPEDPVEKARIEREGGSVVFMGTWRVNGALSVARAIGDVKHKPYICSDADINSLDLNEDSSFIVLGCDGLFDVMSPEEIYSAVNDFRNGSIIMEDSICSSIDSEEFNLESFRKQSFSASSTVANHLVKQAKIKGSTDNISVIVLFLREEESDINSFPSASINAVEFNKENKGHNLDFYGTEGSIQSAEEHDNRFNEARLEDPNIVTKLRSQTSLLSREDAKCLRDYSSLNFSSENGIFRKQFMEGFGEQELMEVVSSCNELNRLDILPSTEAKTSAQVTSLGVHLDRLQKLDCHLGGSSKEELIFTGVSSSSGSVCNALTSSNDSKRNVLESSTDTNINRSSVDSNGCLNKLSNSRSIDAIATKEICNAGYEASSVCSRVKFLLDRKENIVPARFQEGNYDSLATQRRSSYIGSSRISTGRSLMSHSMVETSSNASLDPGLVGGASGKMGRGGWTIAVEDEQDWTQSFEAGPSSLTIERWWLYQ